MLENCGESRDLRGTNVEFWPDLRKVSSLHGNSHNFRAIPVNMREANRETAFRNTGAVEQDRPGQKTNVAPLDAQLDHTYQDPLNKANDSGMANRGQTPEFTGEKEEGNELDKDTNAKVENDREDEEVVDQDPGEQQKENQNEKKDDDLAA
jgi:hypothetical protein